MVNAQMRSEKRIAMAKDTFQKMKSVFTNRNIKMNTKIRVMKTYVWSVLLYGYECWTINKEMERKLAAVEMWFIRRMMRISWTEKKSDESVLKDANLERSLIKTIRKRQLTFLGHICRHKGLEHLSITGKIEGKRSRGRQRNLNWRRPDELRFEFSEPPRSIEVAVQSTANYVLTRDIFLLAIPTRS